MTVSQEELIKLLCDADLRNRASALQQAARTLSVAQIKKMAK
ncbi:MAG: hypothetical protein ACYCVB_07365 [Bacilli bacterium]